MSDHNAMSDPCTPPGATQAAETHRPSPDAIRINWAGTPGWFVSDDNAARIAQLETAGQALADALKVTESWWSEDGFWDHTAGRYRAALAEWDAVTAVVPPAPTATNEETHA